MWTVTLFDASAPRSATLPAADATEAWEKTLAALEKWRRDGHTSGIVIVLDGADRVAWKITFTNHF